MTMAIVTKAVPVYGPHSNGVWPGTPEMIDAGVRAFDKNSEKRGIRETLMAVYNAMVAAAP
mgnify:CR=1 FL=1